MAGPRTGRALGAGAAGVGAYLVVGTLLDGAPAPAVVALPALFAIVCALGRLALWAALWRPPHAPTVDPARREAAEALLATTEVAVVCAGESMVAARTAAIAAVASLGDAERVLLVGADPRLDGLAASLGVRRVASGVGTTAAIREAVSVSNGSHLVLVPASAALLPGALRPALEHLDDVTVWVQAAQHAPADRSPIDHLRETQWWPALDAQDAAPWLGLDSIVHVESFRTLPIAAGAAAVTAAAQAQGWHGRHLRAMLAVEQSDGRRNTDVEATERAARLRTFVARSSPVLNGALTPPQRLAAAAAMLDDLSGIAAAAALWAVVAATWTGTSPVPLDATLVSAAGVVLVGWLARLVMTRGLVRPFLLCRAAIDDLPLAMRAVFRAVRPQRGDDAPPAASRRRPIGWQAVAGRLGWVVAVDVAVARHAWVVLRSDRATGVSRLDVALFAASAVTLVVLLASARVLRRRRTLRGERRLPVEVAATIGTWQGRVLDLSASGMRVEFGAPAELLSEVPLRLHARGVRPVELQAQVVRVEPCASTWVLGLRLTGGATTGTHDEYLALWLTQMAGAAEERPRRIDDTTFGRAPVRAAGAPVVRVLTAAAMVAVGVTVLPVGAGAESGGRSDHATVEGTVDGAGAAPGDPGEITGDPTSGAAPDGALGTDGDEGELLPVVVATEVAPETQTDADTDATTDATDEPEGGDVADADTPGSSSPVIDRPTSEAAGLRVTSTVDDADRMVEGGQLVAHTVEFANTGTEPVALADVVVTPTGVVDPTSIGGTCVGAVSGAIDAPAPVGATTDPAQDPSAATRTSVRWRLFEQLPLAPAVTCTVVWRVTVAPATSLDDGQRLTTAISVPIVRTGTGITPVATDPGVTETSTTETSTTETSTTETSTTETSTTEVNVVDSASGPSVDDVVVVRRPTLRLTLGAADDATLDEMTIGVPFTWVVAVENISPGPAAAHGIDLVQSLPTNWVYTSTVSVNPARCDVAPVVLVDDVAARQVVTWSDACDLAKGERLEIVFTATAQPAAATDPGAVDDTGRRIAHVSEVTLTAEDAGGATLGSATDRAGAVPQTVDLSVRLTDTGADDADASASPAVFVGGTGRYRIDVGNDGEDATRDPVVVTLELPAGITPTGASGEGWGCELTVPVVCTFAGIVAPQRVAPPVVVTVGVGAEALSDDGADADPNRAVVTARAVLGGGGLDLRPDDDRDDETTLVRAPGDGAGPPSADLTITAVTGARRLEPGSPVVFEVLVTNQGPTAEPGPVVVRAEVPTGVALEAVSGDGWVCDAPTGGGAWSCERPGTVAVGEVLAPVEVRGTFTGAADATSVSGEQHVLVQAVSVTGTTAAGIDATEGEVSWTAVPAASLGLVVRQAYLDDLEDDLEDDDGVTGGGWRVGTSGVVKLVVVNVGPSGEQGPVEIVVPTPIGAQIVEAAGDGWTCRTGVPDATSTDATSADATSAGASEDGPEAASAPVSWTCRLERTGLDDGEPLIAVGEAAPPLAVSVVFVADGGATFEAVVRGVTDAAPHRGRASFEVGRRFNGSLELVVPDEVRAGAAVWATVTVANAGPSAALDAPEVQVALPSGWSAVGVDDADWACRIGRVATSVTCRRTQPLLARETVSFGMELRVPSDAESADVTMAAVLAADPDEQDPADDTADVEVFVWGAGATERPAPTTTIADDHDTPSGAGSLAVGDLAGYGGAVGAFGFAALLLSGRRRRDS